MKILPPIPYLQPLPDAVFDEKKTAAEQNDAVHDMVRKAKKIDQLLDPKLKRMAEMASNRAAPPPPPSDENFLPRRNSSGKLRESNRSRRASASTPIDQSIETATPIMCHDPPPSHGAQQFNCDYSQPPPHVVRPNPSLGETDDDYEVHAFHASAEHYALMAKARGAFDAERGMALKQVYRMSPVDGPMDVDYTANSGKCDANLERTYGEAYRGSRPSPPTVDPLSGKVAVFFDHNERTNYTGGMDIPQARVLNELIGLLTTEELKP